MNKLRQRTRRNLAWIADNAILHSLTGVICFPIMDAWLRMAFLVLHGRPLAFPLELWLLSSSILAGGWAFSTYIIKWHYDMHYGRYEDV